MAISDDVKYLRDFVPHNKDFIEELNPIYVEQLVSHLYRHDEVIRFICHSLNTEMGELLDFIDGNGFEVEYDAFGAEVRPNYPTLWHYPRGMRAKIPLVDDLPIINREFEAIPNEEKS